MLWERLFGQAAAAEMLQAALAGGNLSHGYLFTGPAGVGKMLAARIFASYLLYPPEEEGREADRERVLREVHPDLLVLRQTGHVIRIDEVRELISELEMKPLETSRKVAVVDEADNLNREASNAFLKTLEEPPPGAFLIFVSARPDFLLPTVRSRLSQVRFRTLPEAEVTRYLAGRGLVPAEARHIYNVSGGVFRKILLNLENPDRLERWSRAVGISHRVQEMNAAEALLAAAEIQELVEQQVKALGRSQQKRFAQYAKALDARSLKLFEKRSEENNKRELAREKRRFTLDILDGMASWFRDIMVLKLSDERPEEQGLSLVYEGAGPDLEGAVHHLYPEAVMECLVAIERTRRALASNVNVRLALEDMLLRMHEVTSPDYNWPGV